MKWHIIFFAALILLSLSAAAETIRINPSETFNYHINGSSVDINVSVYVTLKTGSNLTLSDINKTYTFNHASFIQNRGAESEFGFTITNLQTPFRNNLVAICFNATSNVTPKYSSGIKHELSNKTTTYPVTDFGDTRLIWYSGENYTHTRYGNAVCINQTWGTEIIVDPFLGLTSVGASEDYSPASYSNFFKIGPTDGAGVTKMPTNGTAYSLTIYTKHSTNTGTCKVRIYNSSNVSGVKPGSVVSENITFSCNTTYIWYTHNFTQNISLRENETYWLGSNTNSGNMYFRYDLSSPNNICYTGDDALPDTVGTCTAGTPTESNHSAYLNYTTTEAPPTETTKWLNVSLNVPNNTLINNTNNVTFNYTLISSNGTGNCTLYLNGTATNTSINTQNNTAQSLNASLVNGSVWWNIACWYNTTLSNYSETYNITVSYPTTTTTLPVILTVSALQPPNNTGGPENMSFNYSVVGSNTTYQNCTLYLNGTLNQTATAQNNTNSTFNVTLLGTGTWYWNVSCWINATVYNTSNVFNYTVNATPAAFVNLTVTLREPPNNTAGPENMSFNFSVNGTNTSYGNCTLYLNNTLNQSIVAQNGTNSTYNITYLGPGRWEWEVTCWINATIKDTAGRWNYTVTTTTTTTTTMPWVLSTLNTANNTNITNTNNATLNYTVTGSNTTYNCTLLINGTTNISSQQTTNNTLTPMNVSLLGNGTWTWQIICSYNTTIYNASNINTFYVWYPTTTTTTTTAATTSTLIDPGEQGSTWLKPNLSTLILYILGGTFFIAVANDRRQKKKPQTQAGKIKAEIKEIKKKFREKYKIK